MLHDPHERDRARASSDEPRLVTELPEIVTPDLMRLE
jgi:hypothetical protein